MLEIAIASLLAVVAGVCVVTQQVLNASLRSVFGSAVWPGVVSYLVGLACMIVLVIAVRDPLPSGAALARVPWWGWTGGALGATFIALAIVLIPKLGAATFIALLFAGQMITSVAFDHFGLLGLPQRPVDVARLAGIALMLGGIVLIRR